MRLSRVEGARLSREDTSMAKGQKKTNRETRKPKAEHNTKKTNNASKPSLKTGTVKGLENMRNGS